MGKLTRMERRELRKKRKTVIFYSFIFIFVVFLITMFLLKSSFFNIDNVLVRGNKKLTREEIVNSSALNHKENIFRANLKESKKKIRELPYIEDVKIDRKYPNKVEIEVVERKALFLIQKASKFLKVDEQGFFLEEIEENEENFPVFTGLNVDKFNLGDNVFSLGLSNVIIEFIQETIDLRLIEVFHKINLKEKDNIEITLKDGVYIAFGKMDNVNYKLNLLNEVLKDSRDKNIKFTKIIMNKGANPILVTED